MVELWRLEFKKRAGKPFLRKKVFPRPFQKTLKQGNKIALAPSRTRADALVGIYFFANELFLLGGKLPIDRYFKDILLIY